MIRRNIETYVGIKKGSECNLQARKGFLADVTYKKRKNN
jgi:hypothetical protein